MTLKVAAASQGGWLRILYIGGRLPGTPNILRLKPVHPVEPIDAISRWSPARCIAFLEQDGDQAPEYDLETDWGLERLREDCKRKAFARQAA